MEYISIRTSTLRGDQKINFDAYLKINSQMILYVRKGDTFEGIRRNRLIERKVKKMYIATEEEPKYRAYLKSNIEMAYDHKSKQDLMVRAEVIQGVQQTNIDDFFENTGNKDIYEENKNSSKKYVDFLLNNDQSVAAILKLENSDKNLAHHGISVATLSVALARQVKIDDPKKIQLMTLGAFLHDIGHHESQVDLFRPTQSMSREDYAIYISHAKNGAIKMQDKGFIDKTVINIIMQHEELIDGSGPEKLRESQQDPLVTIVSAANQVDRLITFEGVPKLEAPKKILVEKMGKHKLEHLKILGDILKSY